jgi:hypothetical protein
LEFDNEFDWFKNISNDKIDDKVINLNEVAEKKQSSNLINNSSNNNVNTKNNSANPKMSSFKGNIINNIS